MKKLVIFRAEKARKRLMPLAFSQWHLYRLDFMVEMRGVEPLSESNFTALSPGAVGYCGRRYRPVPLPAGKPTRRQVR